MRLIRFYILIFIISYSNTSSFYASSDFSNVHPGGIYITEISAAEYNQDLLIDGQKILKILNIFQQRSCSCSSFNRLSAFFFLSSASFHWNGSSSSHSKRQPNEQRNSLESPLALSGDSLWCRRC